MPGEPTPDAPIPHANVGPDDGGGRTATEERSAAAPAEHESREPDQRLLRALADLDNLRKRYARELEREQRAERSRVAAQWLPVVDDLERALIYADEHDDPLAQGLRAVYEHALTVLARLGYPRFEDAGRLFDPVRHESVGVVESPEPTGTVTAVLRPGYGTDDEMLRPAAVVVARGPD